MSDIKYEDLTESQKSKLCNGAGRPGFQGWLIPDFVFTESANRHDFDYWKGCTEDHKKEADRRFLENMLDASEYKDIKNKQKRFILFRIFFRRIAIRYYGAVTELGGSKSLGGFHFADSQRTKEDLITQFGE